MKLIVTFYAFFFFSLSAAIGQPTKVTCHEKERKTKDADYPDIIKTCFLKNFKFVKVTSPDADGRYFYSEYKTYILKNNKCVEVDYTEVFNKNQDSLVSIINKRIQEDYQKDLANPDIKDCLRDLKSIPLYKMNDFSISFENDEIWFEVHWGEDGVVCRSVDGTIVSFKLSEMKKYQNNLFLNPAFVSKYRSKKNCRRFFATILGQFFN